MTSANGRGRTLYEILTGQNRKDMRPLELQYHNPLAARVGGTVSFDHEPSITNINFVIEGITVYKTVIRKKSFYHTDYELKGISLDHSNPVRLRMRLIPDENIANQIGHRVQILYLYDQMEYNEGFHKNTLGDPSGEIRINQDDEGNELQEPRKYWRIEDVIDPYEARVTVLRDTDGDGTIEDEELEHFDVTYWDYHRNTESPETGEYTEFLTVEMNKDSGYFNFLRGTEVLASQVTVF